MSRMEKPSIDYVFDIVDNLGDRNPYNNVIVEWLNEYKIVKKIDDYTCLNCGKRHGFAAYFCYSPFAISESITPQNAQRLMSRPKISLCAYEFYCEHPDKLVEWITE